MGVRVMQNIAGDKQADWRQDRLDLQTDKKAKKNVLCFLQRPQWTPRNLPSKYIKNTSIYILYIPTMFSSFLETKRELNLGLNKK